MIITNNELERAAGIANVAPTITGRAAALRARKTVRESFLSKKCLQRLSDGRKKLSEI